MKAPTFMVIVIVVVAISAAFNIYAPYDGRVANAHSAQAQSSSQNSIQPQPIKAEIINSTPSRFTIDVEFMENSDADTKAELFAVYVSEEKPSDCGDFRDTELSYNKPEEYKRQFDLSGHDDILNAIEQKQCVIIPNTPAG